VNFRCQCWGLIRRWDSSEGDCVIGQGFDDYAYVDVDISRVFSAPWFSDKNCGTVTTALEGRVGGVRWLSQLRF
jgi:hypothetical protein